MRKTCLLLLVVALLVPAALCLGQDMEPKKYEGTWYLVYTVDFEPGMRDKALEHITANFAPAGMESGTGPAKVLIHHTGDHDMTMLWKLEGGPADLEWEMSPDDVKWAKAMVAHHGGMEGMQKSWQEYMDMVDDVNLVVARTWSPMAGGDDGGAEDGAEDGGEGGGEGGEE